MGVSNCRISQGCTTMNIEIIDAIVAGITSNIGSTTIASIFFFVAGVFLLSTVLNIEPFYALIITSIPFIIMVTMLSFYVSWGLGLAVLLIGLVLAVSMSKLFLR
jgi:hypothetical protein